MTSVLGPEWNISPDGINTITENGTIKDYNKILTSALNADLKEIGSPVLTKELTRDRTSKLVLQIQKIRNISAPKANEESQAAPRMLKLILTDGDGHVQAIEISSINSISRNHTPPGTKILINNVKIFSGYLLLTSKNCSILGGKVPYLLEKWELAKSIQRNKRGNSPNEGGPPPWVNFGAKILTGNQDNSFKSLGAKSKEVSKDNSEFELQRQGAIAEASAGAIRKVFGGRVKQTVQPVNSNQNKPVRDRQDKTKRGKIASRENDTEEKPVRPSEKVSLFAFLEDKLPLNDNQNTAKHSSEIQNYSRGQSANINRHYEGQNKPINSQQNYHYQNYNSQNHYDAYQTKFEKNTSSQNSNRNDIPRQFDKQQSNNYGRNSYQNKSDNFNSASKQYEKPKQQKKNDFVNSTTSQDNSNIQKEDLNDISSNMSKMSLNSQFASRSLRQHLNLAPAKKNDESSRGTEAVHNSVFNVGDECLAKYWEDGKFYNAVITAITEKTYAVRFKGYGNIEEILKSDCIPVANGNKQNYGQNQPNRRYEQNSRPYSGPVEFRRSNRNYK